MGIEPVPVVGLRDRIPGPVRGLEVREDDPRVPVLLGVVAPDVEVPLEAPDGGPPRLLEQLVLVGGVIEDELGDDPQPAPLRLADELLEVRQRPVVGMHAEKVRDVVPVVAEGGRIEGQEPDRGHAEVLEVVQLLGQALEVAFSVLVAVGERADVELVDDGVLVPAGLGRQRLGFRPPFARHRMLILAVAPVTGILLFLRPGRMRLSLRFPRSAGRSSRPRWGVRARGGAGRRVRPQRRTGPGPARGAPPRPRTAPSGERRYSCRLASTGLPASAALTLLSARRLRCQQASLDSEHAGFSLPSDSVAIRPPGMPSAR